MSPRTFGFILALRVRVWGYFVATSRTVGKFIRDLLFNKKYFNTMLPPIPVPVMKSIEETVQAFDHETAGKSNDRGGRDVDEDQDENDARPRRRPYVRRWRDSLRTHTGLHIGSLPLLADELQVAGFIQEQPQPDTLTLAREQAP